MALEVVPERVIAPGYDTTTAACLSEFRDGNNIYLEIFGGGYGGGAHSDGVDGIDALSNCSNIPMEAMELDYLFFRVGNYAALIPTWRKGNTEAAWFREELSHPGRWCHLRYLRRPLPHSAPGLLRRWSWLPRGKPHHRTRRRDHPGQKRAGAEERRSIGHVHRRRRLRRRDGARRTEAEDLKRATTQAE